MEYERLTEWDEYGNADIVGVNMPDVYYCVEFDEVNILTTALNRLAELEDKIESGDLVDRKEALETTTSHFQRRDYSTEREKIVDILRRDRNECAAAERCEICPYYKNGTDCVIYSNADAIIMAGIGDKGEYEKRALAAEWIVRKFSCYIGCSSCPCDRTCDIKNNKDLTPAKCMAKMLELGEEETRTDEERAPQ